MRIVHSSGAVVSFFVALMAFGQPGCGGSTSNHTDGDGGLVGAGGNGAGGNGVGGTADGGSSGAGAGGASSDSITCGKKSCGTTKLAVMMNITLPPCCPPEAPDQCGALNVGNQVCISKAPGTPDPSCPTASVMGFPLQGCCMANGMCGVNAAVAGLGCTSARSIDTTGRVPPSDPIPCGGPIPADASVDPTEIPDSQPAVDAPVAVDAPIESSLEDVAPPVEDASPSDDVTVTPGDDGGTQDDAQPE